MTECWKGRQKNNEDFRQEYGRILNKRKAEYWTVEWQNNVRRQQNIGRRRQNNE